MVITTADRSSTVTFRGGKNSPSSGYLSNQPRALSHGKTYPELQGAEVLLMAMKSDCLKAERNDVKSPEASSDHILRKRRGEGRSHETKVSVGGEAGWRHGGSPAVPQKNKTRKVTLNVIYMM